MDGSLVGDQNDDTILALRCRPGAIHPISLKFSPVAHLCSGPYRLQAGWSLHMPTYNLKLYRRVSPGSTVGEFTKKYEFNASGMAEAERIAAHDHVKEIDFNTDFAILEGDTGFVSFWLTGLPDA
jgi:hypothetical protein